jgi:hypothetical protein
LRWWSISRRGTNEILNRGWNTTEVLKAFTLRQRQALQVWTEDLTAQVKEFLAEKFPGHDLSRVADAFIQKCTTQAVSQKHSPTHGHEQNHSPAPTGRVHPGPERQYEVVEPVVRQIWLTAEQPCGKRLVPVLRQWLPYYEERYGELSGRQRNLIRHISAATLDRLLAPARARHSGRGRGGTKPGSLLRSEIPIRTGTWDLSRPGYLEADSVAHCGTSLAGSFIWSLTYTDILSGWTEGGAVWNKGSAGVLRATREVEEILLLHTAI